MSCDFAHLDGSYVLGALPPTDRQQFEQHLASCAECARSVREFAGLPGLLARVDVDVLESPPMPEPLSPTLLPALVRRVRRTQRRRVVVTTAVAAAATAAVAFGSVALLDERGGPGGGPGVSISAPAGAAMTPVRQQQMSARLAFESVQWGTRLNLTCSYVAAGEYGESAASTYALFVHTRDGRTEQVATWGSLPGKTMKLVAATAVHRRDITSVEVRTAAGRTVLTLAT